MKMPDGYYSSAPPESLQKLLEELEKLQVERAFLLGLVHGMNTALVGNTLDMHSVLDSLPPSSVIPSVRSLRAMGDAALTTGDEPEPVVEAEEGAPGEGLVEEAPAPKPQTAEQMFPWPRWKPEGLDQEHRARYERLSKRKYGAGSIIEEIEGSLHKLCPGCLEFRDVEREFYKSKKSKDGVDSYCRKCSVDMQRVYTDRKRFRTGSLQRAAVLRANSHPKRREVKVHLRICEECRLSKPLNAQNFRPVKFSDGHRDFAVYCLSCESKREKKALETTIQQNATARPHQWLAHGDTKNGARAYTPYPGHPKAEPTDAGEVGRGDSGVPEPNGARAYHAPGGGGAVEAGGGVGAPVRP